MTLSLPDLAALLAAAHRDGTAPLPASAFAHLDRSEAESVRDMVSALLDEDQPAAKIGLAPDGSGLFAPIRASKMLSSAGQLRLPPHGFAGVEVEVAVRLNRQVGLNMAQADDSEWLRAVDETVIAIEIIASRFDDRKAAGTWGNLADDLSTGGIIVGAQALETGLIDGWPISVSLDGEILRQEVARHPFGSMFNVLRASCGNLANPIHAIGRGAVITTGSLCLNLIQLSQSGRLTARLGEYAVEAFLETV